MTEARVDLPELRVPHDDLKRVPDLRPSRKSCRLPRRSSYLEMLTHMLIHCLTLITNA